MFKRINKGDFLRTHKFTERKVFAESGRSMVEMLGTLAIIGILSVVGIKAFNIGMTQHRANELINEAQKRAVMVAAQIMAGRDNLSVAEFKNPEGYTFGVEQNPQNEKQFNITITGVSGDVCKKMKTMVGEGTTVRVVSEFCDKLTFNDDLSTTAYASDIQNATECANAGNTWCGGSKICQKKSDCCDGKELSPCEACLDGAVMTTLAEGMACDYNKDGITGDGICSFGTCKLVPNTVSCNANTGICACQDGGTLCNMSLCCTATQTCNASGTASGTKCVTLSASGSECTTNADCPTSTPWCKVTANSDCRTPTTGVCMPLGEFYSMSVFGLGEVTYSGETMNWWSARNWCQVQKKRLINIEDFHAYRTDGTPIKTGNNSNSPLCAEGKQCGNWSTSPYNSMWNGATYGTLTDAKDESGELYKEKYSPVALDIGRHFVGTKWGTLFWTASAAANTCAELTVAFGSGMVKYSYRQNESYVLCK